MILVSYYVMEFSAVKRITGISAVSAYQNKCNPGFRLRYISFIFSQ